MGGPSGGICSREYVLETRGSSFMYPQDEHSLMLMRSGRSSNLGFFFFFVRSVLTCYTRVSYQYFRPNIVFLNIIWSENRWLSQNYSDMREVFHVVEYYFLYQDLQVMRKTKHSCNSANTGFPLTLNDTSF